MTLVFALMSIDMVDQDSVIGMCMLGNDFAFLVGLSLTDGLIGRVTRRR